MVSSWLNSSVKDTMTTHTYNSNTYYVIDTKLLFKLVEHEHIFPVSSTINKKTVSSDMMSKYVDLITKKCYN